MKQQSTQPVSNYTCSSKSRVPFTYHSSLIRKVTNLFKNTNLKITYQTTNTIYNLLRNQQDKKKPSEWY